MKRILNSNSIKQVQQLLAQGVAAAARPPLAQGLQEARLAFEAVLKIDPQQLDALNYLADLSRMQGDTAQALVHVDTLFRYAVVPRPEHYNTRALLYQALARYDEALADCRRAITLAKHYAPAYANGVNLCRILCRQQDAVQLYEQARANKAQSGDLLNNLGSIYFAQQDFQAAARYFHEALKLTPGSPVTIDNLLKIHLLDAASSSTSIAALLGTYPQHVIADAQLLIAALQNLHTHRETAALERLTLQGLASPLRKEAAAFFCTTEGLVITLDLSDHYQQHGQVQAAYRLHEALNEAEPASAQLRNNFGSMAFYFGNAQTAKLQFEAALALNPGLAMAHVNAGVAALALEQTLPALAHFRQAVACDPDNQHALVQLLFLYLQTGKWDDFYTDRERFAQCMEKRIRQGSSGHTDTQGSLQILSLTESAQAQLNYQKLVAQQFFLTRQTPGCAFDPSAPRKAKGRRIKVGYFSYDLRNHPVAYLTAELYGLHNREQFEVFVYSYGPNDDSATSDYRRRIAQSAEHFIDLESQSLMATAQTIYAENLDILVDLTGNTQHTRSSLLGLRLADVQAHWLGYIATSGHACMDYIISDAFTTPLDHQDFFTEKIVRLPHTLQINDRQRAIAPEASTPTRADFGLPPHGFVFCNFGQIFKIQPKMFAAWMDILQAVPQSVLWLAEQNPLATDNLYREAAKHGITKERLIFAKRLPIPQYLARYRLADLMLDTTPIGSGTSASDCLWAGCPLLMLAGQIMYARMCGGILMAAQLPQLITHSIEAYVQKAIELAHQPSAIAAIKTHLRTQRDKLPLFDTPRTTLRLEQAYIQMHARCAAAQAPDHISISD